LIFHILSEYFSDSILSNLFRYITFRSLLAALAAFLIVFLGMKPFVRLLQRARAGQQVRDDGPKTHFSKKGTPTMGGVLIVWAVTIVSVLLCRLDNSQIWIVLLSFVSAAALGFADDFLKLSKKNSKGVSSKIKMIVLGLISLCVVRAALEFEVIRPEIYFPFFKDVSLDIGSWFYLWGFLVIVGCSNAVNLTDGLDGLAIVPVMTTAVVLMVIAYASGHALFANYLQLNPLAGSGEISIVMAAVIGSGLGFLWFNSHPAEIFMGDVGSLSLGTILGVSALLIHQEIVLLIAGFLFVMEAMSVILQVAFYKSSKKRVFKMAPLHHHFELAGWPEPKVIVRFWILSIVFAVIALTTLKLR